MSSRVEFARFVDLSLQTYSVAMDIESAGRKSGALGAEFENLISITNRSYDRQGLGVVKKNYAKMRHVGQGRTIYAVKSTVDYDGYLRGIGFVAFDCKTTYEKVWRPDRAQIHQYLYLLNGQRTMPREQARFFYLIEHRELDDSNGSLLRRKRVYLVENLEKLREDGKYVFDPKDEVREGAGGALFDYRKKLLEELNG